MELKTEGSDQKFCNATHVADETQMCTTECTVDTLENWTSSGGIDRQLVSEIQKGQNDQAAGDRSDFARLGKELEKWVQLQLNESQLNGSVSVEPTDQFGECCIKKASSRKCWNLQKREMRSEVNGYSVGHVGS